MEGDSTQKPNTPIQCANNCGFFGNPLTANYCSKCYRDISPKPQAEEKSNVQQSPAVASAATGLEAVSDAPETPAKKVQVDTTKCFSCAKKVGLLGFKCRCDYTFCSMHRYADKHECSFDYKAAGKAAIAKANPLVSGSKITKI